MFATSSASAQTASIAAAVLIAGVATFQVALAFGMPLGGAVFGGKAATRDGVLIGRFRVAAAAQAVFLGLLAWILLARTGVSSVPWLDHRTLVWLAWAIVVFLVVNTIGNFAAPHPVERWVMGPTALILLVLCAFIASRG